MEVTLDSTLKEKLTAKVISHLEEGLSDIRASIKDAEEAANQEEKSSAGDKFETGREMMQLEMSKLASQENQQYKMLEMARAIRADKTMHEVQSGAVVRTEQGVFLFLAPVGKLKADGVEFYGVSIQSPLGQKLLGLKKGETTELNGRKLTVLDLR